MTRHCALAVMFFLLAVSASAHHATATEYDISQNVIVKGTILYVDWANPHIHAVVHVKAERNVEQDWDVELPSPAAIVVAGLSKQTFVPG